MPQPPSPLIGRHREMAELGALLARPGVRQVTVTGMGGCGKTRLALHVAASLAGGAVSPDGAAVVELAPVMDPALVPQVVAAALGVREAPGVALVDSVMAWLRPRSVLLVLDNCEHLIDACARLVRQLLAACPGLRILATSRERLRIEDEWVWPVPPLLVPGPGLPVTPDALGRWPAVELFVARAQAVNPRFQLTARNAGAVAEVCRRLDGIPLALELAAARVQVLPPAQILERLDDAMQLLTGGSRTAPTRLQTLRATLDWSHALLTVPEQVVFRRLAVFAGGWSLEAAESICGEDAAGVLDLLTRLVDKSLVLAADSGGRARFQLLEPVRQYATERLAHSGETDAVRVRHAGYYAALVERAAPALHGPEQIAWLGVLDQEQDNLRAALSWFEGRGDVDAGVRMATALVPFWEVRGHLSEGRRWLEAMLTPRNARGAPRIGARARALIGAGRLGYWTADLEAAAVALTESLALAREVDDHSAIADSLTWLGAVRGRQAAFAEAAELLEAGLTLHQTLGDEAGATLALHNLGAIAANSGDVERAVVRLTESLRRSRALGNTRYIAFISILLVGCLAALGDLEGVVELLPEGVSAMTSVDDRSFLLSGLGTLAMVALQLGQPVRAVRLLAAAEAGREALGTRLPPVNRATRDWTLTAVREHLGEADLATAWAEGRALTLDDALREVLALSASSLAAGEARPARRARAYAPPSRRLGQRGAPSPRRTSGGH